ncbi:MAG TPA: hypothetical protein VM681_04565 [Candidatus Thermoplasmatota archaeon]|nr:hypothetical protein [Candidatus Thermoplasmatota archaeon]
MALGWVLVYGHEAEATAAARRRFERKLFGYVDRSHRGKYAYERPGFLTGKPHRRLRRGALLLPLDLGEKVAAFVREHEGWVWSRKVELSPTEAKQLYPLKVP